MTISWLILCCSLNAQAVSVANAGPADALQPANATPSPHVITEIRYDRLKGAVTLKVINTGALQDRGFGRGWWHGEPVDLPTLPSSASLKLDDGFPGTRRTDVSPKEGYWQSKFWPQY